MDEYGNELLMKLLNFLNKFLEFLRFASEMLENDDVIGN